jgi:hypothetical protein
MSGGADASSARVPLDPPKAGQGAGRRRGRLPPHFCYLASPTTFSCPK